MFFVAQECVVLGHKFRAVVTGLVHFRISQAMSPTPKILLEHAVLKLDFALDLSHLKRSRVTSVEAWGDCQVLGVKVSSSALLGQII